MYVDSPVYLYRRQHRSSHSLSSLVLPSLAIHGSLSPSLSTSECDKIATTLCVGRWRQNDFKSRLGTSTKTAGIAAIPRLAKYVLPFAMIFFEALRDISGAASPHLRSHCLQRPSGSC
eukprot:GHVU01170734.1.p2 GENE.GHVU01170734.1~~GHVU01170734.1.p2  ORF type:complete len:118 (-),score=0.11 GHVU01170734.1:394-747(-)